MRPVIEVRGLRKDYRRGGGVLHAVDGIDLALMPGESVGVIGETGSGNPRWPAASPGLNVPRAAGSSSAIGT